MSLCLIDSFADELWTASELAAALGRPKKWVYRATELHGLPVVKVGRSSFYQAAAVREWIAQNTYTAASEARAA